MVIKAKTPEGFTRALKVQICSEEEMQDFEFKLVKFLAYDGTENLNGQIILTHNALIFKDPNTSTRIAMIEMELA